jgi:hypothetical protein
MRYIKRFKIGSGVTKKWYWVCVYDNIKRLREGCAIYKDEDSFDDCEAVCQPYTRVVIEKGKPDKECDNLGTIRILKNAGSRVTAHEVLHASLDTYRRETGENANFGRECSDKEEKLCHIFGDFYGDLVYKMYKFGFWK